MANKIHRQTGTNATPPTNTTAYGDLVVSKDGTLGVINENNAYKKVNSDIPTNHAVNANTYGYATETLAGHMRVTQGNGLKLDNGTLSMEGIEGNADTWFGTSTTAASTAAKVVTLADGANYKRRTGTMLVVRFSTSNTATTPSLTVGGVNAQIRYNGQLPSGDLLTAGDYLFQFDGTYWNWIYHILFWNVRAAQNTADTAKNTAENAQASIPLPFNPLTASIKHTITSGTSWVSPYTGMAMIVVVGGGASGTRGSGNNGGDGGGSGYVTTQYMFLEKNKTYPITIGAGGVGGTSSSHSNGGTTSFGHIQARGGVGYNGGSGGGQGAYYDQSSGPHATDGGSKGHNGGIGKGLYVTSSNGGGWIDHNFVQEQRQYSMSGFTIYCNHINTILFGHPMVGGGGGGRSERSGGESLSGSGGAGGLLQTFEGGRSIYTDSYKEGAGGGGAGLLAPGGDSSSYAGGKGGLGGGGGGGSVADYSYSVSGSGGQGCIVILY